MPDAFAYKDAEIMLKVVKCGCGNPLSHQGRVCPEPRSENDLGTVSYISKNPLKRLWWRFYGLPASIRRIQNSNRSS